MAVMNTNLIKPVVSGLDNMPLQNNSLGAEGLQPSIPPVSQPYTNPTNIGINQIFNNSIAGRQVVTEQQVELNKLANSVNTQAARIAAGTGTNIAEQYISDEHKKKDSLIMKVLNVLDAPRNAIMNGFNYTAEGYDGGFLEGFWNGLTRQDEYTGYDFAEDLGFTDGPENFIVGFTSEIFLDPLNWIELGAGTFIKGFAQGAVKSSAKEIATQTVREGIGELGAKMAKEGIEEGSERLISSGLRSTLTTTAKDAGLQASQEAAIQGVKQVKTGALGILNNINKKLFDIETKYGLSFGNAKLEAVFRQAIKETSDTAKLAGGLSDDVLTIARTGEYGEEIKEMAETFVKTKQALAGASDDIVESAIDTIPEIRKQLIKALEPHKLDLRFKAFEMKGINANELKEGLANVYENTMYGALKSLEKEYNVTDVGKLLDVMKTDEKGLYMELIHKGFGERVLAPLDTIPIKNRDIERIKSSVLDSLLDTVAAEDLYKTTLKKGMKELGTGLGFNPPFSTLHRDIKDANEMFELGARARAALSTRINEAGELEATIVGRVLDDVGKGISSLVGHLPIIGAAMDDANKLQKADRWALKFIQRHSKGKARLSAEVAENSIEKYYYTLKKAGIKTPEEVDDIGAFVGTAIESKVLTKADDNEKWLKQIMDYTTMDDITIDNKIEEQMVDVVENYKKFHEISDDMLVDEITGEPLTDIAEIKEALGKEFTEYYDTTKAGLTRDLTNRVRLKDILNKYDDKQQRAILEVTRGIAEDFDNIGRQLADLHLIPDGRMYEAEYWYFPHKMNLELMLENEMDVNRTIGTLRTTAEDVADMTTGATRDFKYRLGGKTSKFTIKDVSSWQRKYPMSAAEVNRILKDKYGIDNMLETNAFNTYLLYAIDQGKVISEAEEITDMFKSFGIRVNSKDMIPYLRAHGYSIVTRKSNIEAMELSRSSVNALKKYNDNIKEITDKYVALRKASRDVNSFKSKAGKTLSAITNSIETSAANNLKKEEARQIIRDMKQSTKKGLKKIKSADVDVNYITEILTKEGILPKQMDDIVFTDILDSIVNNEYIRGNFVYMEDTLGSTAMPEIMATNVLKTEKGMPQLFMGNVDNIGRGFRNVPREVDLVPDGDDFFYVISKRPFEISVDNLTDEMNVASVKYSKDIKKDYLYQGYDSIRLTDKTGATVVIPFDESSVFYRDRTKQAHLAGKYKFAEDIANTTDGGYVGNPNAFIPSDDRIYLHAKAGEDREIIPYRKRAQLAKILDTDYKDMSARIKASKVEAKKLSKKLEDATESLNRINFMIDSAETPEDKTLWQNIHRERLGEISALKDMEVDFIKSSNNISYDKYYEFVAGLHKNKWVSNDIYITKKELYDMMGSNKEAGLMLLGYDAVVDHTDDIGKMVYKTLPNADKLTKENLLDIFESNLALINTSSQLSGLEKILTDNGTGRDELSKLIESIAVSRDRKGLERTRNTLSKLINSNTKDLDKLPDIPKPKSLTASQSKLIGRLVSADSAFSVLNSEKDITDFFNITDNILGLSVDEKDIWAVPSEIIYNYNRAIRKQADEGTKLLKDIMWRFNKIWKPSVTAWRPSFGVRNLMSGYFNSFFYAGARIFDPDITRMSLDMVTGKNLDDVIELGGNKYTLGEIKKKMVLEGASNGVVVTDVTHIEEMLSRQMKKSIDPKSQAPIRHPLKTLEKMNASVEDYNRNLLFLAALKNGETPEYAGDLVRHLQFDYSDLSDFEKRIKTIMPFYTWVRNNLPLQVERFMDDPRLFQILMKRVPDFGKEVSGISDEEWDNMPKWVKDLFPIALGKDKKTGRYRLWDTTLPYQDLAKIGDIRNMWGEGVSLLHPLIKIPQELFLNKNLYTGAALESYEGETAEKAIQGRANPILNALATVAPNTLRKHPGITVTANQFLNTFGTVRDLKYFNNTQGSTREGTVYGSKDVGVTGSSILNYLENALLDTNQMKYYAPEKGMQDTLYKDRRDLGNLIQKLNDQGYAIPDRVNTKGAKLPYAKNSLQPRSNTGIMNVGNAQGFPTIDGGRMTELLKELTGADLDDLKNTFEQWLLMDVTERPKVWYDLVKDKSRFTPSMYNEIVSVNFNKEKLKKYIK